MMVNLFQLFTKSIPLTKSTVDDDEQSHLIDITTIDGAMDLFMFSNILELLSVLDSNLGAIPLLDREAIIYARRTIRIVLAAFFYRYTIEESGAAIDKPHVNVYLRYLVRQIRTLHSVIMDAAAENNEHIQTPEYFQNDIETAFGNCEQFWQVWDEEGTWSSGHVAPSFLWEDAKNWTVVEKHNRPNQGSENNIAYHISLIFVYYLQMNTLKHGGNAFTDLMALTQNIINILK